MKRRSFIIPAAVLLLLTASIAPASPRDAWTSVRSQNFFLIGNASEKEIRQVATRLEQFRDVFTRLFKSMKFTSPVPTTVIVFKSRSAYKPFNPGNNAGYFQPGPDVNYITLSTEYLSEEDEPFKVIFHEYVHLLVNNTMANMPLWFNEGLAEYYSTFYLDDERKAYLGKVVSNHVLYLREQKMLPLKALFAVDYTSPYYNEGSKRGVFYAESWALVHYLIQGNKGQRLPQFNAFLNLLAAGTPVDEAFKKAFQVDYAVIEKELRDYVQGNNYTMTRATFERKLELDNEVHSAPITEAEAQSYLGDLLLHLGDLAGAEKRLEEALRLNPDEAMANSSLGLVKVRQGKSAEAMPLFKKAIAAKSENYLVHFNYAFALSREGMGTGNMVSGYTMEAANEMRSELKKAIELAPTFPESYHLLAFVNLVRNEQIDESIALLKRGMALSPGREEFSFMLAQLYMRKQDFKLARQLLEPLAHSNGADRQLRANAQSLLETMTRLEEQMARFTGPQSEMKEGNGHSTSPGRPQDFASGTPPKEEPLPEREYEIPIRKREAGEEQALGLLLRIDCDARGATFTLKIGDGAIKLHAKDFNGIKFTTYTPDVTGEITCGPRKAANNVVVTYRPVKSAGVKFNGELVAVEFVPKDFQLKQ